MDERRTERVSSAVTPSERHALETIAKALGTTVSELIRRMGVNDAVVEYTRLMKLFPNGVA